jgi:hypothetical protein
MKIRTSPLIIAVIGVIIVLTFPFIALAANDVPHNASNNISCGSCHGEGLLNSHFWGGNVSYDQICLSCHTVLSGSYTETSAPFGRTHSSLTTSSKYGNWKRRMPGLS